MLYLSGTLNYLGLIHKNQTYPQTYHDKPDFLCQDRLQLLLSEYLLAPEKAT